MDETSVTPPSRSGQTPEVTHSTPDLARSHRTCPGGGAIPLGPHGPIVQCPLLQETPSQIVFKPPVPPRVPPVPAPPAPSEPPVPPLVSPVPGSDEEEQAANRRPTRRMLWLVMCRLQCIVRAKHWRPVWGKETRGSARGTRRFGQSCPGRVASDGSRNPSIGSTRLRATSGSVRPTEGSSIAGSRG